MRKGEYMKTVTLLCLLATLTGCMQVIGAKKLDAWGLKVEANSGVEFSTGVMQFDGAHNAKTMGK